jgi:hypothetical protein
MTAAHDAETTLGSLWREVLDGSRVGHAEGRRATIRIAPRALPDLRIACGRAGIARVMGSPPWELRIEIPAEWADDTGGPEVTAARVLGWWAGQIDGPDPIE